MKTRKEEAQSEDTAFLMMILNCLVENRTLFETDDVDLDSKFFKALKDGVIDAIERKISLQQDVRKRLLNAFSLNADDSDGHFDLALAEAIKTCQRPDSHPSMDDAKPNRDTRRYLKSKRKVKNPRGEFIQHRNFDCRI